MTKIIDFLAGKKTYIVTLIGAIFNALLVFGVLTLSLEQIVAIDGVIIALAGASIRDGINKK